MCFPSVSSPPPVPQPTPPPKPATPVSPGVVQARRGERRRAALAQGRQSTLLTGPVDLFPENLASPSLIG